MQPSIVSKLTPLAEYQRQRELFFASKGSLDWYLRKHRDGLIAAGAVLLIAGRWFVDPDRFDSHIVAAGTASAKSYVPVAQD